MDTNTEKVIEEAIEKDAVFTAATNANWFHDYSGIEEVFETMSAQYDNMMSSDFQTLADPPLYSKKKSSWFYKKNCCMVIYANKPTSRNSAVDGEEPDNPVDSIATESKCNRIPMKIENGEVWSMPYKDFKRPPKYTKKGSLIKRKKGSPTISADGYWQYERYYPCYDLITKDIQTVYEIVRDFKYVWSSLDYKRMRNVLVCDVDDEQYNEDTDEKILNICRKNNIPMPTYIERHVDRKKHYQFGWILDEPILFDNYYRLEDNNESVDGHTLFIRLLRTSQLLFPQADSQYTGLMMKNPNALRGTQTTWFNDKVSTDDLIKSFLPYMRKLEKKKACRIASEEDFMLLERKELERITGSLSTDYILQKSRHIYTRDCLRTKIFQYMQQNGTAPTFSECFLWAHQFEEEACELLQKKYPRSESEIRSDVESVLAFCIKNYKAPEDFSDEKRAFGLTVRRAYRAMYINSAHKMKNEGRSYQDIQNVLGKSERTIRSYLNENEPKLDDILALKDTLLESMYISKKAQTYLSDCEEAISFYFENFCSDVIEEKVS